MSVAASAGLPKHERLRQLLLEDIERAAPRAALPTERELAVQHRVSRATVRQALDALEDAGAVYRVQGAGTFVAGPTISKSLSLTSFSEDMTARGLVPSSRLLSADVSPAGDSVAQDLRLDPTEPVVRLVRVRLADDTPMCLEMAHLPAARVPGLLERDLNGSLYEVLVHGYGIRLQRADQQLNAVVLDEGEAALLGVPPGSPALRVTRIGWDDRDRPTERTTSVYRADRYDIRFAVRKEQS